MPLKIVSQLHDIFRVCNIMGLRVRFSGRREGSDRLEVRRNSNRDQAMMNWVHRDLIPDRHESNSNYSNRNRDRFDPIPHCSSACRDESDGNCDHGDPIPPHEKSLRKNIHRDTQCTVGAEFHDDAGEQHRAGGRRGDVTGRRPRVQRPDAAENGEAEK